MKYAMAMAASAERAPEAYAAAISPVEHPKTKSGARFHERRTWTRAICTAIVRRKNSVWICRMRTAGSRRSASIVEAGGEGRLAKKSSMRRMAWPKTALLSTSSTPIPDHCAPWHVKAHMMRDGGDESMAGEICIIRRGPARAYARLLSCEPREAGV